MSGTNIVDWEIATEADPANVDEAKSNAITRHDTLFDGNES